MESLIQKFLDNPCIILKKYKKNDSDWCYSKNEKNCSHSPKCNVRKYNNLFYDRDPWYPILTETIKNIKELNFEKKIIDKTNRLNPLNFQEVIERNNFILEKTKKDYISLYDNLNNKGIWDNINEPELFIKSCSNYYSFSTIGTCCKIILSYMKCLDIDEKIKVFGKIKGKKLFRDYHIYLRIIQHYLETKGETEHFETETIYNDIIKGIETCENDIEIILMRLYIFNSCLRTDYNTVKLSDFDKDTDNYFDRSKNSIIFNTLKKNNNSLIIALDKETSNLIQKQKDKLFLFETKFNQAYTSKNFSKFIKTVFTKNSKNNLNLQKIRKIVVSHLRKNIVLPNESKEIAKNMNHSETMSKYYYNQN